jgi:glycosyltransferase involved in cell wall biosynthesis
LSTRASSRFLGEIHQAFRSKLLPFQERLPADEVLRIDLHCHDLNSDQPSVRLGRLLGARETWLPSEELIATQRRNGATAHTITNHNNARSCWELQDQGYDVLVGAEFDCSMPDQGIGLHVLTFGFEPRDEERLRELGKRSVYAFLEYTRSRDLPTVLAHPLYYHTRRTEPIPVAVWERLALLFERFEVLNGQRDSWQNLLVLEWLEAMTPERLEQIARREGIPVDRFCEDPYTKRLCGGSDDHMGILSGSVGTRVHVPGLQARLQESSRAELALEGLRRGALAPYGGESDPRKMGVAFLDYFCQLVEKLDDPGLLRLLLHRGSATEKAVAFGAANAIFELRRHKLTTRFLQSFHGAMHGKPVGLLNSVLTSRKNRRLVHDLNEIASSLHGDPSEIHDRIDRAVGNIHRHLLGQAVTALEGHLEWILKDGEERPGDQQRTGPADPAAGALAVLDRLELPLSLRSLLGQEAPRSRRGMSRLPLGALLDQLSFPVLSSAVISTANFVSIRSMFDKREFLDRFARRFSRHAAPQRAMWLTDTFGDGNGVSISLRQNLRLIQEHDLPIDMVVCSSTLEPEPHLRVMPPVGEFRVPFYTDQLLRLPDLLELQRVYVEGGYTRILSSTEGPLGLAALYLRHAFQVPAFFVMHTDWPAFAQQALGFNAESLDRLKRMLRLYYRGFEGGFVLNDEHRRWLTSREMGLDPRHVHVTHHWLEPGLFRPAATRREELLPGLSADTPVLLYVGRVSREKGTADLPVVLREVRGRLPGARLVVIGTGPDVESLKAAVEDLIHVPWIDQERLPAYYSAADVLVLPSTFDTFGRVALEAISCGLPVAAYDVKGPREILVDGASGLLCRSPEEMGRRVADLLLDGEARRGMTVGALERARQFEPERILRRFLELAGLPWPEAPEREPTGLGLEPVPR